MEATTPTSSDRLIREGERKIITSISRCTAWRLERLGLFPKRRKLYPHSHAVVWLQSEINEWVASRQPVNLG
jgi:prophage regulatory protein